MGGQGLNQRLAPAHQTTCKGPGRHAQNISGLGVRQALDQNKGDGVLLVVRQSVDRPPHRQAVRAQVFISLTGVGHARHRLVLGRNHPAPALSGAAVVYGDPSHYGEGPAVEPRTGPELRTRRQRPLDRLLDEILRVRIFGPQNPRKSAKARKKLHKPRLKFVHARFSSMWDETSEPKRFIHGIHKRKATRCKSGVENRVTRLKVQIAGGLAALLFTTATPAWPQIGPLQPPRVPGLPSGLADRLPLVDEVDGLGRQAVDQALRAPARAIGLVRRSRGMLEADPNGWPVVAGEIIAIDLSDAARTRAIAAGFTLIREERLEALDLSTVVFAPPRGQSLGRAVARLRDLDPDAEITFNHIYSPAGSREAERPAGRRAPFSPQALSARLGLIDTGVDASHPALVGSRVTQRGFAGPPRLGAHGTAVASLMVGRSGAFSGANPGGALLAADIYGGQATGGSSSALAQALAWMVEQRAQVVNVSLVGPRNALVERAVERAQVRGLTIVAAVGNDGPAAPPLYPASYKGVVGVTAVNARNRVLPEAGRGPQVDFAAPGADMAAAGPAGTWTSVRGASFASPIVAGLLAGLGGDATAVQTLSRSARDLGDRGRDPVYGAGLVGADLRVAPSTLGARGRLNR